MLRASLSLPLLSRRSVGAMAGRAQPHMHPMAASRCLEAQQQLPQLLVPSRGARMSRQTSAAALSADRQLEAPESRPARPASARPPQAQRQSPPPPQHADTPALSPDASTNSTTTTSNIRGNSSRPAASKKPKVRFDMARLSTLSGHDKVLLLRDFVKHGMTAEAVVVFNRLKDNGLILNLKYQDHHALCHLLLADAVGYRAEILWIVGHLVHERKVIPSANFLADFVKCARKWGDLDKCLWAIEQMVRGGMDVGIETWNDLLGLYAIQKDVKLWMDGVGIWYRLYGVTPAPADVPIPAVAPAATAAPTTGAAGAKRDGKATPTVPVTVATATIKAEPDLQTYITIIGLFGRLNRLQEAQIAHDSAIAAIQRLYRDYLKNEHKAILGRQSSKSGDGRADTAAGPKRSAIKVDAAFNDRARMRLFNALLGALIDAGANDRALALAHDMLQNGVLRDKDRVSQRTAKDTFGLLLKLCAQSRDRVSAEGFIAEARLRGVRLDAVVYGRMIQIYGSCGDMDGVRQWLDKALQHLELDEGGMRWHDLHTAYLRALVAASQVPRSDTGSNSAAADGAPKTATTISEANDYFFGDYRATLPEGKHIMRIVYLLMVDANREAGNTAIADKIEDEYRGVYASVMSEAASKDGE